MVISPPNEDVLFTVTTPPNVDVAGEGTTIPPTKEEFSWTTNSLLISIFPANEDTPSLLMLAFVLPLSLILKELKQSMVSSQLTLATFRKPANDALPVWVIAMLLASSASYIIKLCP